MSTWLASHPTALTELLGQATRPLPTQLPHPPSSTFCPLGPLHPGSPISSHSLERPTQVASPSPHHTPVSVRAYARECAHTHTHTQLIRTRTGQASRDPGRSWFQRQSARSIASSLHP